VNGERIAAHSIRLTTAGGKILPINLIADPERLSQLDLVVLND
jgi:hypothetical protein